MPRVAVIGAGWSGLACALALADTGVDVVVLEAAPHPGGRARRVLLDLGGQRCALDNGQHLLIGAYAQTLRLLSTLGIDSQRAFLRLPFTLRYADGVALVARGRHAPWHLAAALLTARGLSWRARAAALGWVTHWRRRDWRLAEDVPAAALFARQPRVLIDRLWEPLCLAALNVRLPEASAQILLNVLREVLDAEAPASDLLLPRGDLSRLLPDSAAARLADRLRLRAAVQSLERHAGRWRVVARAGAVDCDAVVLALPPDRAAHLLRPVAPPAAAALEGIAYAPITTVYLRYATALRLPQPIYALRERPRDGQFGQWVFDRGQTDPDCAGVLSVVISGAGTHQALDGSALAAAVARQLAATFGLPAPAGSAVIAEKRATIVPRPGLVRPPPRVSADGLYLAGDAAASPFPSTIEGSVRAGLAAAEALRADCGLTHT